MINIISTRQELYDALIVLAKESKGNIFGVTWTFGESLYLNKVLRHIKHRHKFKLIVGFREYYGVTNHPNLELRHLPDIHSKIYFNHKQVIIGSHNLNASGWTNTSIITNERHILSQIKLKWEQWWKESQKPKTLKNYEIHL